MSESAKNIKKNSKSQNENFCNLIADSDFSQKSMNRKCSSFIDIFTKSLSNIKKAN